MTLAAVSCSLGGGREGGPLIAELQGSVAIFAFLLTVLLWAGGAARGIPSFANLQRNQNIAGERV